MKSKTLCKVLLLALAVVAFGAFSSTSAFADPTSLQFILSTANSGLQASGPGPYATVTFTYDSGHLDVTLQGLSNGVGGNYSFFGNGAFAFNGAAGLTISNVTSGYSVASSPGNLDGFGTFVYQINGPTPPNSLSTVNFQISIAGGFSSANWITQLGIFNSSCANLPSTGCSMAAQIAPFAGSNNTGFAGTGDNTGTCTGCNPPPPPPTPEPASMILLGSGLVGMGGWLRKRNR